MSKNRKLLLFSCLFLLVLLISGVIVYLSRPSQTVSLTNKTLPSVSTSAVTENSLTPSVTDSNLTPGVTNSKNKDDPQPKDPMPRSNGKGVKTEITTLKDIVGTYEKSGLTTGIDVSFWQGNINWAAVKNAGIEFAMIRAGYRTLSDGKIYEDSYAKYNMQKAQEAGIKLGIYFYSTANSETEAQQEAEFVCNLIAKYRITYPVAFNYEGYLDANNRNYGLNSEKRTSISNAFIKYVKAKGYPPCFYGSKDSLEHDFNVNSLSACKIWVSDYPNQPYPATKDSSYKGKHQMWQFTSLGHVDGINGNVDINIAFFGFSTEAPPKDSTAPEKVSLQSDSGIYFEPVNEKVTAKIEANLRSTPVTTNNDNIVATIHNKDVVTRTGISKATNWSRVEYNGQILYVLSDKVTSDLNDSSQADASANSKLSENGLYQIVNEEVTAKEKVNLRKTASTTGELCGTLLNGQKLTRVGIGSNGWSKLSYNNTYVYVSSMLITTDLNYVPPTPIPSVVYKEVDEQVTAIELVNLRAEPSQTATLIRPLKNGEYIKRIGIGTNNWSKLVDTDGKTVYAMTNLLQVK